MHSNYAIEAQIGAHCALSTGHWVLGTGNWELSTEHWALGTEHWALCLKELLLPFDTAAAAACPVPGNVLFIPPPFFLSENVLLSSWPVDDILPRVVILRQYVEIDPMCSGVRRGKNLCLFFFLDQWLATIPRIIFPPIWRILGEMFCPPTISSSIKRKPFINIGLFLHLPLAEI